MASEARAGYVRAYARAYARDGDVMQALSNTQPALEIFQAGTGVPSSG